jgi:hypothetical protein
MGRGGESTLRIDEPLHFMFLVAYLITYFCCAYLLVNKNKTNGRAVWSYVIYSFVNIF